MKNLAYLLAGCLRFSHLRSASDDSHHLVFSCSYPTLFSGHLQTPNPCAIFRLAPSNLTIAKLTVFIHSLISKCVRNDGCSSISLYYVGFYFTFFLQSCNSKGDRLGIRDEYYSSTAVTRNRDDIIHPWLLLENFHRGNRIPHIVPKIDTMIPHLLSVLGFWR